MLWCKEAYFTGEQQDLPKKKKKKKKLLLLNEITPRKKEKHHLTLPACSWREISLKYRLKKFNVKCLEKRA